MADDLQKGVPDFQEMLGKWKEAYVWETISCIAIKTAQGEKLLFGRVVFHPWTEPGPNRSFTSESKRISVSQTSRKIGPDSVDARLEDARNGMLRIGERSLQLPPDNSRGYPCAFYPISPHWLDPQNRFMRLPTLAIHGGSKDQLLRFPNTRPYEDLEWDLRSSNPPYFSLDDLLREAGLPILQQMADWTTLEIIAGPPAQILGQESAIAKNKAEIHLKIASNIEVNDLRLGYVIPRETSPERGVSAGNWDLIVEEDFKMARVRIPVRDAPFLQAFLSFREIALHQIWISDPEKGLNPRFIAYEKFDEKLGKLKEFLFERAYKKDRASDFEHGVAVLLWILGFSDIQISFRGIKVLEDAPDLIGFTPRLNMIIVECTVGLLNNSDKLAKLVARTAQLKESLVRHGYGFIRVQSAIVTALSRDAVKAELGEAGEHQIAVISRDNLEAMLERIKLPANPDGLFEEAIQLIPIPES